MTRRGKVCVLEVESSATMFAGHWECWGTEFVVQAGEYVTAISKELVWNVK